MDEDRIRMSDVPTGQIPLAENQSRMLMKLNGLIEEIDGVLNAGTSRPAEIWLRYVRIRIEKIVKAVAVDTKEERTTASQALHGGDN